MKVCSDCQLPKAFTEFSPSKSNKDGLRGACKDCRKAYSSRYRKEHKDSVNLANKAYRNSNLAKAHGWEAKWRKSNPGKVLDRTMRYWAAKLNRMPKWLKESDLASIRAIYDECAHITASTGVKHEVDHIIPLRGKIVSGLHVPQNLRVITKIENARKRNHYEGI